MITGTEEETIKVKGQVSKVEGIVVAFSDMHDDHGMQAGKEWGETTESKDSHQEEEWGKSDERKVSQHDKEWGKNSENQGNQYEEVQSKVTENSRTVENNAPQCEAEWGETGERVVPDKAVSKDPDLSDNQQHQAAVSGPCPSTENSKEGTDTTVEVTSKTTPQDVPEPQRELMQSDSAENDSVEVVSPVNEIQPPLDKEDSPDFVKDKQQFASVNKTPDEKFQTEAVHAPESEVLEYERNNCDKQIIMDTSVAGTLKGSGRTTNERDDTASVPVHCIDREQTSEGEATAPHASITQKAANLPKLNTKGDKKVTFDSEENEQVKNNDSQNTSSVTIGDIPPTPDFLKFDHSLQWGDIEIDDEDSVVIEPKW